jgi:hypothetical protein
VYYANKERRYRSVAGMATGYELEGSGIGVRVRVQTRIFALLSHSGLFWGPSVSGALSPWVTRPDLEADHWYQQNMDEYIDSPTSFHGTETTLLNFSDASTIAYKLYVASVMLRSGAFTLLAMRLLWTQRHVASVMLRSGAFTLLAMRLLWTQRYAVVFHCITHAQLPLIKPNEFVCFVLRVAVDSSHGSLNCCKC